MEAVLIFIVLPMVLIALSFRIKPLVKPDARNGDAMGRGLSAQAMFGGHGLEPDPLSIPEETETVRFELDQLKNDDVRKRE